MEICDSDEHSRICFASRNCPFCEYMKEMEEELSHRDEIIDDLKERIQYFLEFLYGKRSGKMEEGEIEDGKQNHRSNRKNKGEIR